MNLRISKQEIRFRMNKDDFISLVKNNILKMITNLPNSTFETSIVISNDIKTLSLIQKENNFTLKVNKSVIIKLHEAVPTNQSFATEQIVKNGHSLKLILEIDFLSYKRNRGR
ncbi:hypothetical protein GUI12_01725 [Anaplasmataceae bacterium AB001_6]|nr:hypothetical protein GUI12_01725 [Anaplasmataceae bacterium AB001_6]